MDLRAALLAAVVLALPGCSSWDYGYGYCYDPYGPPRGYYYGPLEPKPDCAKPAANSAYYLGPHLAGYRGPYVSGPYFDDKPPPDPS